MEYNSEKHLKQPLFSLDEKFTQEKGNFFVKCMESHCSNLCFLVCLVFRTIFLICCVLVLSFSFSSCKHPQPHAELVLYLFLFLLYLQLNLWMGTWSCTDFWQSSALCADKHSLASGTRPTAGASLVKVFCSCISKNAGGSAMLSPYCFEIMIFHHHCSH